MANSFHFILYLFNLGFSRSLFGAFFQHFSQTAFPVPCMQIITSTDVLLVDENVWNSALVRQLLQYTLNFIAVSYTNEQEKHHGQRPQPY
jgi:hypothetical protein